MSASNDNPDPKDPFEFKRVFDAARAKHNEMEKEGSRWHGIPGEGSETFEIAGGRQKRLLQFQQLIDPRSIGLFFAHELSNLDQLRKARYDLVGLSAHNHHKHGLNATHYEYVSLCASKYMPVMAALDRLDHPFGSEFAPFYVMELQRQGVVDLLDPEAHDNVLNTILRSGRLSTSFLSSKKNGFSKCPFHSIHQVFSLSFKVSEDHDVTLQEGAVPGALLPFIIQRLAHAHDAEPVINESFQIPDKVPLLPT